MEVNRNKNTKPKKHSKIAKCPICKNKSITEFLPFCSKKCSDLDLMKWLSDENYINLNE